MRVLVTGGAGFIGSHLSERLLQEGHVVGIIDELNDYYPPHMKLANLAAIRQRGTIAFFETDICDESLVKTAFQQFRPDAVVHLAARAGVRPSLNYTLLYESVNIRGTIILLEACRTFNVKKFVFASSSSVYGLSSQVPFREDDCDYQPISPYAATKLAGEQLCRVYSHLYDISIICLRLFTVYGPRQRPDLAIRKFTQLIDLGHSIPVYGDGLTGRDYTFVDDVIPAVLSSLALETSFDIFNIGSSRPITLNELVATIEKALGRGASIQRMPMQAGDVILTFADISKAGRLLGYDPRTSFEDGIGAFVKWFREQHTVA